MLASSPLVWERGGRKGRGGGRVGTSLLLRVLQGAMGAGENLGLVFHGVRGSAFSTALRVLRGIAGHHVWSEADRYGSVQMLVNGHGLTGQAIAPAAFFDLPPAIADRHRVVLAHHALGLNRKHPFQVAARALAESSAWLRRLLRK